MYSKKSHVLHLGNVANTAANAVTWARRSGRNWALRLIPPAPDLSAPSAWFSRASDAHRYAFLTKSPKLAHIHYGPNGYYGELKRSPYIVHLHGSDLRVDLNRRGLGTLERRALKHADFVVVATPDLLEAARELRPDARWVPNSVPTAAYLDSLLRPPRFDALATNPTVFFSARWDDSKGGRDLVDLARALVCEKISVVGLDWGHYAEDARSAGVDLLPLMRPIEFTAAMGRANVVVGQFGNGALTISDLEAMTTGVPVVTHLTNSAEKEAPLINRGAHQATAAILDLLNNRDQAMTLGRAARDWVLANRSPETTLQSLESVYRSVLG